MNVNRYGCEKKRIKKTKKKNKENKKNSLETTTNANDKPIIQYSGNEPSITSDKPIRRSKNQRDTRSHVYTQNKQ